MQLSNIYFAYRNYIHSDYGASWDLMKKLIKGHNVDERVDRTTIKYLTEDVEKSDILIKKGYYAVSFDHSQASSVDRIKDFYLRKNYGSNICFDTGRRFPHYSDVHVIVKREEDIARITNHVELQKVNIPKEQIVEKIESQLRHIKKPKIRSLLTLNKDFLLVEGELDYLGEEYPFFGVLLQSEDTFLIEEFRTFLHVLLIDGKHYFVTYWQEPECGKRGLIIYTLEGKALKQVFADYSDGT